MATDDDTLTPDDVPDAGAPDETGVGPADDGEALDIETYDLNHDGKISPLEGMRAEIGLVDARLEEIAEQPGIKGKLADAAHHLLDKLDND